MRSMRFPGPRWAHAALCFALAAVATVAGLAAIGAAVAYWRAPGLPVAAALVLTVLFAAAVVSPHAGGPRPRLWMTSVLGGLLVGAIAAWIEMGGAAHV